MSEFTNNTKDRVEQLVSYAIELHSGNNGAELIRKYQPIIDQLMPSDLIVVFDVLMEQNIEITKLKSLANKLLNVFYKSINKYPIIEPSSSNFISLLVADNRIVSEKLWALKTEIKRFNRSVDILQDREYLETLKIQFVELQKFTHHYTAKENILFPLLEVQWEHYKCTQLMWSYHDDIRRHLKWIISQLEDGSIDLKPFNRTVGDLYFAMYAIVFREDKILFPTILESISSSILEKALLGLKDIPLAYVEPQDFVTVSSIDKISPNGDINLETGSVSVEQIKMMFNHLPVDITYVDENDEVKYFSTPKHRIFPRTIAVIGRKVHHCHPPESVHIVEKIVESFKNGHKDEAVFWIKMGPQFVLIKYFAVRDDKNRYRGVLEVSQEVSDIRALEGERRLLDW